jgi:hypothetical protein
LYTYSMSGSTAAVNYVTKPWNTLLNIPWYG